MRAVSVTKPPSITTLIQWWRRSRSPTVFDSVGKPMPCVKAARSSITRMKPTSAPQTTYPRASRPGIGCSDWTDSGPRPGRGALIGDCSGRCSRAIAPDRSDAVGYTGGHGWNPIFSRSPRACSRSWSASHSTTATDDPATRPVRIDVAERGGRVDDPVVKRSTRGEPHGLLEAFRPEMRRHRANRAVDLPDLAAIERQDDVAQARETDGRVVRVEVEELRERVCRGHSIPSARSWATR